MRGPKEHSEHQTRMYLYFLVLILCRWCSWDPKL